jgi:outer membrane protein OmpA-like peptidoglycan-associated protein
MTRLTAITMALTAALLTGCATQPPPAPPPAAKQTRDDLYVVLPSREGKAGAVTVTHAGDQKVLDRPYAAARIKVEGQLETGVITEQEVREVFGPALAAQPLRPVSFTLYFVLGRDELTPESRPTLESLLAEVARRPAVEVVVIGHTDRVGSVQHNDALSLQRAEKVRGELVRLGIPYDRIQVAGRGEREPLVPTEDQVPEPRNRRVEITVR